MISKLSLRVDRLRGAILLLLLHLFSHDLQLVGKIVALSQQGADAPLALGYITADHELAIDAHVVNGVEL